jgi:hypothetical protein
VSVVTAKRLDASRITGATHLIVRQPRVLGRCSPFGRREFWHRRWRRRGRPPAVLAKYPQRQDRQGFPWPFERPRRAALARESWRRSRCCSPRRLRTPAACPPSSAMAPRDFRKPPNPGRATAAISSPAVPAVPRNSFSRRPSRRMRATKSPAGSAAPRPAPRNSPFSSRAQAGEFSPPAAIGPAGKQAKPVLDYRQAAGPVPAGATRAG